MVRPALRVSTRGGAMMPALALCTGPGGTATRRRGATWARGVSLQLITGPSSRFKRDVSALKRVWKRCAGVQLSFGVI